MAETEEMDIQLDIPEDDDGEASPAEEMTEPFNPADIHIVPKQDSLRNLIDRLRHDEIDMNTDFQRRPDLWNPVRMSRLVESILIRFPLPAFYFDATDDDNWLIVDGLQRLSAIRKFVVEKDPKKRLRLRGMEYLKEFDGKNCSELPRTYQRRIDECPVTLFLIQPGTPSDVKYSIFRRINTGGLVLNNQEIRNAMAKPDLRRYIEKLAGDPYLRKIIGEQKRMMDQEMVLRFLAFYEMDYEKGAKNIATFLDAMMERLKKADSSERERLAKAFRAAIQRSWDVFGDKAFEKRTRNGDERRRRKNSTLFEVWTVALARLSGEEAAALVARRELLEEKHLDLMTDDEDYFHAITFSTQKKANFRVRHERVNQLIREVLDA